MKAPDELLLVVRYLVPFLLGVAFAVNFPGLI